MGRRRFEMFQYRAVLVRLRQGDSDRDIARARLMGRPKVAALRVLADRHGWLIADAPLPEDAVIAAAIGQARRARSTISSVEPFRERLTHWAEQGVSGVAIRRTWCFVMTLCFSRHQYAEFVWDQTVVTWLGCHRRAFEWFTAVPARLIIDAQPASARQQTRLHRIPGPADRG